MATSDGFAGRSEEWKQGYQFGIDTFAAELKAMGDHAHVNMYRKDAATYRDLMDRLFHNCPMNKDGLLEPNDHAKAIWQALSEHTYRSGKAYVKECSEFLKAMGFEPIIGGR